MDTSILFVYNGLRIQYWLHNNVLNRLTYFNLKTKD